MSETATEATTEPQGDDGDQGNEPKIDWRAEARKWESRAKENQRAAREYERLQKASQTEAERAVAEAEERGRTAAASEFGRRLARERFTAQAARRNPEFDSAALDLIDLSRFVGDDGEPDDKAIGEAVARLVPEAAGAPSYDGGTRRPPAKTADMNTIIRRAAGHSA